MTIQLLIKADPRADRGKLSFGARKSELDLKPLYPSIDAAMGARRAARPQPVWHIATTELEGASPWDVCHALRQDGLGVAGASGVAFAEPDLDQKWAWTSESRQALGLAGACGKPEPQDGDVYAVGLGDVWFAGDDFSGLHAARGTVGSPDGDDRVRIAHLDTGYDPKHDARPRHLRADLQKNFAEPDRPDDATDRAGAVVNPMLGHGTGTLGLLAGDLNGEKIGGAAEFEIVPIRVANWVVLFKNSAIARALDYVHGLWDDPANRVQVVTMSMGGLASAAWADAVNALYERGIFVVTAAGNNFGNLPTRFIVYPARFRRVVAACGVMADGRPYADLPTRKMAGCYGPHTKEATSLAAFTPNVPWARYGCPQQVDWDGGGTSAATPQIAAAAALWLQKHERALASRYSASQAWMRVEAARMALFDSARKRTGSTDRRLGQGSLRAGKALDIEPPPASELSKQEPDSVSFPILRVLTGLGVAGAPSERLRMLELEALQISQQSSDIEALLGEADPSDGSAVARMPGRAILEALADHGSASVALKSAVAEYLRDGDGAAPAPTGTSARQAVASPTVRLPADGRATFVPDPPTTRRLRVYAFDPLLGTRLETLHLNEATIAIPWEEDLRPGPVGEYLEVVDVDPPSGQAYAPVDLNSPALLAQDGLKPAEGLPQFHQQMVYAVAMKTIAHFERALGRVALWSERRAVVDGEFGFRFVRRLRVYPHALREANAFYDPEKRALLFGYFNAPASEAGDNLPGGLVFTCLSHDIVAHEVSHALLDGIHPRFSEPTNIDMLAFHEAFADIVALFQHFTLPEALRDQIAAARGDLRVADLLGGLARQFGQALGQRGALRSAISAFNEETGEWERIRPSQRDYTAHTQPHRRGAVLVAAVFDAFLQIYEQRSRDLIRLATSGSGVLPPGALPHDLVDHLSEEAAKTAGHVLNICIRALDYCPPVDLTFGEYLRALVTADRDLVPDDDRSYRVAFVSAFRARGIFPADITNLSDVGLAWQKPEVLIGGLATALDELSLDWTLATDRLGAYLGSNRQAGVLYDDLLKLPMASAQLSLASLGIVLTRRRKRVTIDGIKGTVSPVEIHAVRPVCRVGPDGRTLRDVVIEVTQRWKPQGDDRFYRGGATIIYDAENHRLKYIIRKRTGSRERAASERAFAAWFADSPTAANYFEASSLTRQPFAALHRDH